jgi:hypothetical protein
MSRIFTDNLWAKNHGKQKCVRRPPTVDGMYVDEFILRNADLIWLHQNEMWEYLEMKLHDEPEE